MDTPGKPNLGQSSSIVKRPKLRPRRNQAREASTLVAVQEIKSIGDQKQLKRRRSSDSPLENKRTTKNHSEEQNRPENIAITAPPNMPGNEFWIPSVLNHSFRGNEVINPNKNRSIYIKRNKNRRQMKRKNFGSVNYTKKMFSFKAAAAVYNKLYSDHNEIYDIVNNTCSLPKLPNSRTVFIDDSDNTDEEIKSTANINALQASVAEQITVAAEIHRPTSGFQDVDMDSGTNLVKHEGVFIPGTEEHYSQEIPFQNSPTPRNFVQDLDAIEMDVTMDTSSVSVHHSIERMEDVQIEEIGSTNNTGNNSTSITNAAYNYLQNFSFFGKSFFGNSRSQNR